MSPNFRMPLFSFTQKNQFLPQIKIINDLFSLSLPHTFFHVGVTPSDWCHPVRSTPSQVTTPIRLSKVQLIILYSALGCTKTNILLPQFVHKSCGPPLYIIL